MAQLSVRGFGQRWRSGSEMLGGLGQHLLEGLGVALVVASLLLVLALLTYNPGDVSLDTAVDAPTRNFLGPEGALVADVLVQCVGLAAYLVPTVMFGWAFRLMLGRPIRRPLRGIGFLLLALVLGAASCSILHPDLSLPAGAGGTVGWVLL
ncbi:MAG: DNA translocase FtsK 4TM domain-containing protein, partial [Stellaceae bacterium]